MGHAVFRLRVGAASSVSTPGDEITGVVGALRLTAAVEAWGTSTRNDEVVLTAVASALVEVLPPMTALPLIAELMQRHFEQREAIECEKELSGGERARGTKSLQLRSDGRLNET